MRKFVSIGSEQSHHPCKNKSNKSPLKTQKRKCTICRSTTLKRIRCPDLVPISLAGTNRILKLNWFPIPWRKSRKKKKGTTLGICTHRRRISSCARVNRIHMTGIPHPWMNDTLECREKSEHQLDNPPAFTLAGWSALVFQSD